MRGAFADCWGQTPQSGKRAALFGPERPRAAL